MDTLVLVCIAGGSVALVTLAVYYWLFTLPKNAKLPMLESSRLKTTLFLINFMVNLWKEKTLTHAEQIFEFLIGSMHVFRKEGIVYYPYAVGTLALAFKAEHLEKIYKSTNVHANEQKFIKDVLKTGLISNNPPSWNLRRKINTPSFNINLLDQFMESMNTHARGFVKKMNHQNDIIADPCVTEMCYNMIVECFTGMDYRFLRNKVDLDFIKIAENIFFRRATRPHEWFDVIFHKLKHGSYLKKMSDDINGFLEIAIEERITQLNKCGDIEEVLKKGHEKKNLIFLDNLLYHYLVTKNIDMSGIVDEVKTIVAAATDAPIYGLVHSLYLIGLHPEVQRKIQAEIDSIFSDDPDRDVTIEDLKNLRYLEMSIKEGLRLLPPIFITIRQNTEELHLDDGYVLPKDTPIIIPFYGLHRDERFFPNPEVYDPDRFLPENCQKRHPYAYLPFSGGQRNCIGQRFAMNEIKVALAHLFRNCNVKSLHPRDKILYESRLSLRTLHPGVHFQVSPRDDHREAVHG